MFNTVFLIINTYRIHVIVVFFMLLVLFTSYISGSIHLGLRNIIIITAFTSLWAAYYIGNKYFDFTEDSVSQEIEARRSPLLAFWVLIFYLAPIPVLLYLHTPILPYLSLCFITLLYSVHILSFRVKSTFVLKNIYAAISWWLTISIALAYYIFPSYTLVAALQQTVFVLILGYVIELLWDIRDIQGDTLAGNNTLPVVIGIMPTKIFASLLLLFAWYQFNFAITSLFFLNLLFLLLLVLYATPNRKAWFFHSVIYGQLLFIIIELCLLQ